MTTAQADLFGNAQEAPAAGIRLDRPVWRLVPERAGVKESLTPRLDPNEAPPGHVAVLKQSVATATLGNICRACDWRPECNGFEYRCMPYAVVSSRDGRELARSDGCSVVFKRMPPNAPAHRPDTAR